MFRTGECERLRQSKKENPSWLMLGKTLAAQITLGTKLAQRHHVHVVIIGSISIHFGILSPIFKAWAEATNDFHVGLA